MKNKKSLFKKIIFSATFVVTMVASLVLIVFLCTREAVAISFFPHIESYSSSQGTIPSSTSSNDYISMSDANSLTTVPSGKIISISTPVEYDMFASKCESTPAFLGYHYELFSDIDFTSSGIQNVLPIGYNTPFSGQFNGNGYEIKNIDLLSISTSANTDYQDVSGAIKPIQYFALFSKNSGTIANLGLVNPVIRIAYTPTVVGEAYVAPFVGLNTGNVNHCYAKETRSRDERDTGIYTYGPFYVSGFASVNNGTMSNVYASRTVLSTVESSNIIAQAEILNEGTQSPTNAYFYNSTINSYTGTDGGSCTILYNNNYIAQDLQGVVHYGIYCNSNAILTSEVVSHDTASRASVGSWYNLSKYSDVAKDNFKDSNGEWIYGTPIARGIVTESNMTFTISNNREFSYMFELFKLNKNFATNKATYHITSNIDMGCMLAPSYYSSDIGATIVGYSGGTANTAVTIYNAPIKDYHSTTLGINCFGVFPWLTGEVSYINVVLGNSSTPYTFTYNRGTGVNADPNKLAIGAISGYVDGGVVDHCNVYLNASFDNAIGKYYFGGIVGMIGSTTTSTGILSNSTITGTITQTNASVGTTTESVDYLDGMSLGGAVGYLDYTTGSIDTVLANMTITASGVTGLSFHLGGVVASGYANKLNQLNFRGTIDLSSSSINYTSLYVAGVCARLLGMSDQADFMTNEATISVYQKTNTLTYVSGVMNSDVQTPYSAASNSYLAVSKKPLEDKGSYYFNASSLTNKSDITISNASSNLNYTQVLNNNAGNRYITNLSGLYNLQTSNDISIKMDKIPSFAPVLNNIGGDSSYPVEVSTAYNFKNINITMDAAVTSNVTYAGFALGEYVNYLNIHNLGNITATVDRSIGASNNAKTVIISGITKEVSAGNHAYSIYNKGNITINYTATVYADVYASGICYANRNGFNSTQIQQFNPANTNFDSNAIGSLDKVINNGEILVTSPSFAGITYANVTVLSANQQFALGTRIYTIFDDDATIDGNLFSSGIATINESVITNSFNIANIIGVNYVTNTSSQNIYEINSAGISVLNIGMYAYILNSANNGDIKAYNMSAAEITTTSVNNYTVEETRVNYISETNAAGITCKNDELEDGTSYLGVANSQNPHSSQVISFTINYGSIFSYNFNYNITSTNVKPTAKSAGILAMGLCNVINVVNYGNIYGSETASGIFGIVYYQEFTAEVSNNIYIANTLNYGNVYMLERGYNRIHGNTYDDYDYIVYSDLLSLNITSAANYALTSVVRNTDYISIIGSIFSIVNFANANNTENIQIRYLISFDEKISIAGAITAYPLNANPDVSTFYSAHISTNAQTGAYETDTYIGKYTQYAPLISKVFSGNFVTYINPSNGNVTTNRKAYQGVFSSNFAFMKAINGDAEYLDIEHYRSDAFISDYFEFVGAIYVNSKLLDTIGWSQITYRAAAEAFATNLSSVGTFVTYISGIQNQTPISNLLTAALNVDGWLSKCDNQTLLDIIETAIGEEDSSTIQNMFNYIFNQTSSSYSLITTSVREHILESILESDTISISSLIETIIEYNNGYSDILGESVLNNDEVGTYLKDYIESLNDDTIKNILITYCSYLNSANSNGYFTYKNSEQKRYQLLNAMFTNINDSTFYQDLAELIDISSELGSYNIADALQMFNGYSKLTNLEKQQLYQNIILNNRAYNNLDSLNTYINAMASEIGYYSRLIENGYSKTSLTNINTDVAYNNTSISNDSSAVVDERVALWNQIRKTQVFEKYLQSCYSKNSSDVFVLYDLATEYNNTYQSITEPYNNGTYTGTTNRLSYMYTRTITPEVYFYGPYTNISGSTTFSNANSTEQGRQINNPIINYRGLNVDPYNYSNGNYREKYFCVFHYDDTSLWDSNEIMLSRGGTKSTTQYNNALNSTRYKYGVTDPSTGEITYDYPMLLYYDYNNEQFGGANDVIGMSTNFYVEGEYLQNGVFTMSSFRGFSDYNSDNAGTPGKQFRYSKTFEDPVLKQNCSANDWTGTLFRTNDLYMRVSDTNEVFSLNNANLCNSFKGGANKSITLANGNTVLTKNVRTYIVDSDLSYHLVQADASGSIEIGRMNNNTFIPLHKFKNYTNYSREIYSLISYILGLRIYTSTVSTNYHSTGRTGIYRSSGGWHNYFTWKSSKNTRVFTSQYIDYTISDLLNLDGVLTEYDGEYKSTEERNIINRIFNEKLAKDSSNFSKVIAAALLERNMYDEANNSVDTNYLDDFFALNIYSPTRINSNHPFVYLYNSYSSQTVSQYLIANAGSSSYKDKLLAYCASHQNTYAKLILRLIELNNNEIDIGSSTDTGAISIANVSPYSNVYIYPTESHTISGESFTEGILFDSVTVNVGTTYQAHLFVYPKNTSATLTVKIGSNPIGTNYNITTSNNNLIDIDLISSNGTTITLESNQDVVLYKVTKDTQKTFNGTYTYNKLNVDYTDATELGNAETSIYIETAETMAGLIESNFSYYGVSVLDGNLDIRGYNNSDTGVRQDLRHRNGASGNHYSRPTSQSQTIDPYTVSTGSPIPFYNSNFSESNLGCYWDLLVYSTQQTDPSQVIIYCDYIFTSYTYYDGTTTTVFDGSTINNLKTSNSNYKSIYCNNTLDNSTNYATKYASFTEDALYSLLPIDYSSTLTNSSYQGTASKNLIEILGLSELHNNSLDDYEDYCIPCLVKKSITASNSAFKSFIDNSVHNSINEVSDYKIILDGLTNSIGYYALLEAIKGVKNSLTTATKHQLAAAYLATDYQYILDNSLSVSTSKLKEYIDSSMSSYQYITGNTYNQTKFVDFCQEIGYSLSTTGYGIYALASSYGIQDGTFIPDNLVLSSMNPYYDSSYNIVTSANSYWRRGSGATDDAVTDTASVNYAFYEEMKQLKKSISTAIIELDLTDGTNVYMSNTNQTTKSGVDGTITYYITTAELADITTSLDISTLVIANKATLYILDGTNNNAYNATSNKTINVTKNGNDLTTTYKLKVVAEDTTVYTIYDIIFVIIDLSDTFTLTYSDTTTAKTYPYTGGTVDLLFTSLHLRANIDLTPYITITGNGNTYNYLSNKTLFKQYFSYYTYGKYQVTNSTGDAEIKFEVFQELPSGTYTIKVKIGSNEASVTMTKQASTASNIVEFEFDNATVTLNGNTYSSQIKFGRVFDKTTLTIPAGTKDSTIPAYLSSFKIAPNATYSATPSYSYDNVTGLVTYRVTYVITAENGSTTTYYHDLTEMAPFASNATYATVYKNGNIEATNTTYTTTNYNSTTHDLSTDASANISFSRDLGTPEYRIYYTLTNFYITNNNFTYTDVTPGLAHGLAALTDAYAGYTVMITSNCDVGTYVFEYKYHSEAVWGDDTLERNYTFPLVYIEKEASLDSWINNLSLLDSYVSEGTLATKIAYERAFVPNENNSENQTKYGYAANEVYHQPWLNTDGITISSNGDLTYGEKRIANKNYFILGNVSDASLSSYQPTIKINQYAEIYQYLTDVKADGSYGTNQTSTDTSLLLTNGAEAKYLYVPYFVDSDTTAGESEGDEYKIFLVKLEIVNGVKKLTKVYSTDDGIYDSNGDLNTQITTFANLTLQEIHDGSKNTFQTGGKTYVVSSSAGAQFNSSLNMNYIGSPKDGHFWFVSYAVFSEAYLKNNSDTTHADFYHIAIVDLTNNIYFTIRVNVPQDFDLNAIYMNINYVTYDNMNNPTTTGLAVYAIRPDQNSLVFETQYDLAMLPSGYYTFTLELPGGYKVSYTASSQNRQGEQNDLHPGHEGAYLPPSSVVPIEIDLEFTVSVDNSASSSTNVWGIGTSSTRIVTATYSS